MSHFESPKSQGLAWLNHADQPRALRIQEWRETPTRFSFFAPDFARRNGEPWLCGESLPLPALAFDEMPAVLRQIDPSRADFIGLHASILDEIKNGAFQKVVPVVSTAVEFTRPLEARMFAEALPARPHQFSYGFDFREQGLCGITPELLFSVKNRELRTMALAGTGRADGPSLLDDSKERHEHQLVVDHILSELQGLGDLDVGPLREQIYGPLKHLLTPIRLTLNREVDFISLVDRLHPTAALGGWPRQPALSWLQAQEFHRLRSRFGAPFGYWDQEKQEMLCVVAIRCVQWSGARAQISTGCGVVEGSVAEREWQELGLKRAAVTRLLGLRL